MTYALEILWVFAWGPNNPERPQGFICASTLARTRSWAWDKILDSWFSYNSKVRLYYRSDDRPGISRDAAIKFLKRKKGKVIRVMVAPIEGWANSG